MLDWLLERKIDVLYKEFLRHSCMAAHIRHKGLVTGNFTFSLKVSYGFSLFAQKEEDRF